jgi:hypothetical protein
MDDAPHAPTPDSWKAEEAEVLGGKRRRPPLVLLVAGVVAVVAVLVVVVLRIGDLEPTEKAWPTGLGPRPTGLGSTGQSTADAAAAGIDAAPGAYFWRDFDGWHLWVVNGDGVSGLTGTLTSDEDFAQARLSAPGNGTVSTEGGRVKFALADDLPVAGLDFEPGFFADELELDLFSGGEPLEATRLLVGPEPASTMPLRIEKAEVVDDGGD